MMSEHVDIESPMNVLGRDLMLTLGSGVIPFEEGMTVNSVNYQYSYKLTTTGPVSKSNQLTPAPCFTTLH